MLATTTKLSYQRLKNFPTNLGDEETVVLRRSWPRFRRWRQPRVRVPGLRRLVRRKARVVGAAVRVSMKKVLKRLKEGRPHLGDLFAGNYMFMQASPSPAMGSFNKQFLPPPSFKLDLARVIS